MSALEKHSKFYYGWQVTTQNRNIDFNDGSIKSVTIKTGYYTSSDLAVEIKKKMDAASSLDFTVTFNRSTRKFTISSGSTFSLLFGTGPNTSQNMSSVLGYTNTDKIAASSYLAESASGYEYATQFYIQSYKDTSTNRKAVDGVVNEASNGAIEVVKFGHKRFMEGEFLFITNIPQNEVSIVRSNFSGREDFIHFIEWCTEKAPIEFMKIESDVETYQEFILESTPTDSKGLDYDLIEMYDRGLAQYYRSGVLKFRLI